MEEQVARGQCTAEDRERTGREATDVANLAMMIADKVAHEKEICLLLALAENKNVARKVRRKRDFNTPVNRKSPQCKRGLSQIA